MSKLVLLWKLYPTPLS